MPKCSDKNNTRKRNAETQNSDVPRTTDENVVVQPTSNESQANKNNQDGIAKSKNSEVTRSTRENGVDQRAKKKKTNQDGIEKSKQLTLKLTKSKSKSKNIKKKNIEPRLCGNGKPMPPLVELEKLYDDSDDENTSSIVETEATIKSVMAEEHVPISEDKLLSPETINKISTKLEELISNFVDSTIPIVSEKPPPVIPQKKRKKSDIPYIVGCKDRPQVQSKPTVSFCKGRDDYGIDKNNDIEDDNSTELNKRRKRGTKMNLSKSTFNSKTDEIAAMLKETENREILSNASTDSNKTESYEFTNADSPYNQQRPFSPLPSTSRDNETFLKNDQLFNESLISVEDVPNENVQDNDCHIIDTPYETVIINDEELENESNIQITKCKDVKENNTQENTETIDLDTFDGYYDGINVDKIYSNDVNECIDIDEVISESNAIVKKYCKHQDSNIITDVKASNSHAPKLDQQMSDPDSIVALSSNNVVNDTQHGIIDISDSPPHRTVVETGIIPQVPKIPIQTRSDTNCKNNKIEEVVTNFFNSNHIGQNRECSSSSNETVIDLTTGTSDTVNYVHKFFNWLSSFRSSIYREQRKLKGMNLNKFAIVNVNLNHTSNSNSTDNSNIQISNPNSDLQNIHHNHSTVTRSITSPDNVVTSTTTPPNTVTAPVPKSPPPVAPEQKPVKSFGDCPICMDNLENKIVASTNCGHIFCMECIKVSIKAAGKKCPTCRKQLKGAGFHKLFL